MAKPEYTLAFVTDHNGQLFVHADETGLSVLIESLGRLKVRAEAGKCDHDHLATDSWAGSELSERIGREQEGDLIHQVTFFGWTKERAKAIGFAE